MRARLLVVLGSVALVALTVGCAGGTASPSPSGPGTTAGSTPPLVPVAPAPVTPTDPPGVHRFSTFWMRTCETPEKAVEVIGCRLGVGESRTTTEDDVVTAAMQALMAGPDPTEAAVGLTTNIRSIAIYQGLSVDADGIATVKFNRYFETAKTRPQTAQVVYTLTQFPEIKKVKFLIDGMANGAAGATPMDRTDIDEFTPDIFIESPTLAAAVGHRFRATGTAAAKVKTLSFRLVDATGASVTEGVAPVLTPGNAGSRGVVLLPVTVPASVQGRLNLIIAPQDAAGDPAAQTIVPVTVSSP